MELGCTKITQLGVPESIVCLCDSEMCNDPTCGVSLGLFLPNQIICVLFSKSEMKKLEIILQYFGPEMTNIKQSFQIFFYQTQISI